MITNVEKVKSNLFVYIKGREIPYKVDLNECEVYGNGEKPLTMVRGVNTYVSKPAHALASIIINLCVDPFISKQEKEIYCKNFEILWSSKDEIHIDGIPSLLIPEGYIKFLKENNYVVNNSTVKLYKLEKNIQNYPQDLKEFVIAIKEEKLTFYYDLFIVMTMEVWREVKKCYTQSLKKIQRVLNILQEFDNFFDILWTYYKLKNNFPTIPESNLLVAAESIQELLNIERGKKIKENQSRLLPLQNKIIHNDLQIIIPTELQQFTDEGKQQNNCVGSFYHQYMAENECLILFIRKKEELEKSYITVRISTEEKMIIEMRKKNNAYLSDDLYDALREEINPELQKIDFNRGN